MEMGGVLNISKDAKGKLYGRVLGNSITDISYDKGRITFTRELRRKDRKGKSLQTWTGKWSEIEIEDKQTKVVEKTYLFVGSWSGAF